MIAGMIAARESFLARLLRLFADAGEGWWYTELEWLWQPAQAPNGGDSALYTLLTREGGPVALVTPQVVARGLRQMKADESTYGHRETGIEGLTLDTRRRLLEARQDHDLTGLTWQHADAVVQVGLFQSVRYDVQG